MPTTLHTIRARDLQRTLGTRRAAGFLRNRGYAFEVALFVLTGRVIA